MYYEINIHCQGKYITSFAQRGTASRKRAHAIANLICKTFIAQATVVYVSRDGVTVEAVG